VLMIISSFSNLFCQNSVQGKIVDLDTEETLAFVNIIANNNPQFGTSSDIDGLFSISLKEKIDTITLSYVGYKKLTIDLKNKNLKKLLVFKLEKSNFQIDEIVVKAGENPANRIIRNAIKNRKLNNPENISSFKYSSYNKTTFDFVVNDAKQNDSLKINLNKFLRGGYFLIMESVSERKYLKPDRNEEIITGTKVSGFKHPSFATLATDFQPFSFYKSLIEILDISYLNPISVGSLKKYYFSIEDTLIQNIDTCFVISFKPLPNKNFEALTGLLYVNSKKFAIQNIKAEPFEKGLINIKIQQKYKLIDGEYWFPEQLNFDMLIKNYPSKKVGTMARGKSYIKNVELFAEIQLKNLSVESLSLHEKANQRDTIFWNNHRVFPLNERELITYHTIDSVGKENKFDAMLAFIEKISFNKIPISLIDIDIQKTFVYNKFEGYRLGIGAYTNEKLFNNFSIGGFFGYGTKDHQWKYGGELIWNIDRKNEFEFRAKYENTLSESGELGYKYYNSLYYNVRDYLSVKMDRKIQESISLSFRALRFAKIRISFGIKEFQPQYDYGFGIDSNSYLSNYNISDLTINLRYAFREKIVNSFKQRISMGTKFPILYLTYTKGIKDVLRSEFDYNKLEIAIEKTIVSKNIGKTYLRFESGFIDRTIPFGLLFSAEGSFSKDLPVLVKNSFQTIRPNEFLSDKYLNFYFSHNFGSLLFKTSNFKPQLSLHQNYGLGYLSNPEFHSLVEFDTKENGYFESGIQIDNLIKLNYFDIAYLGFGAAVFYRYGYYSFDKIADNFAFKLSITLSTN